MTHGNGHPARPRAPFSYRALTGWGRIAMAAFYRRVEVTGAARLPRDHPAILAYNHGNGLGDVAVIVATMPRFPRFLASASWWKSAPARLLFRWGGVVPIHRRRDGDTEQNRSMFDACNAVLADGEALAIFPEGEMHLEPALMPLRTGAARIALGAAADAGVRGVVVVPIGLVYEDVGRFRSEAEVAVGEPIAVDEWIDVYRVDPAKIVRAVTDLLADRLAEVTVNHGSHEERALLDRAAALALADAAHHGRGDRSFARRNRVRRAIASALDDVGGESGVEYGRLARAVAAHEEDLTRLGLDPKGAVPRFDVSLWPPRIALDVELVALAPAAFLGLAANAPMLLGVRLAASYVRGEGWQATVKGVTGTVLSPLAWGIEAWVLARRLGAGRAVVLTAVGAAAGFATIGWWEAWKRRRRMSWRDRLLPELVPALDAAHASRAEVRRQVEALVGELPVVTT